MTGLPITPEAARDRALNDAGMELLDNAKRRFRRARYEEAVDLRADKLLAILVKLDNVLLVFPPDSPRRHDATGFRSIVEHHLGQLPASIVRDRLRRITVRQECEDALLAAITASS